MTLVTYSNRGKEPIALSLNDLKFENFNQLTEAELELSLGKPLASALNPYMTLLNACPFYVDNDDKLNHTFLFRNAVRLSINSEERTVLFLDIFKDKSQDINKKMFFSYLAKEFETKGSDFFKNTIHF